MCSCCHALLFYLLLLLILDPLSHSQLQLSLHSVILPDWQLQLSLFLVYLFNTQLFLSEYRMFILYIFIIQYRAQILLEFGSYTFWQ